MDLTASIEPKSDQLDAVDLIGGPRTFTVKSVAAHNSEQPVNINLVESDRPWRPSKSMRRVLVAAWGADGKAYEGRRLTLYCDPDVEFGGIKVGGSRISHMSHIDKPLAVALLIKRGKSAVFTVQPLRASEPASTSTPAGLSLDDIAACTDAAILRKWWTANPALRDQITARKAELDATAEESTSGLAAAKAALHGEQGALA